MNKYIKGDVNLSDLFLKEIPEIFKGVSIEGSLNLSKNGLTTLDNFTYLFFRYFTDDSSNLELNYETTETKLKTIFEDVTKIKSQMISLFCPSKKLLDVFF